MFSKNSLKKIIEKKAIENIPFFKASSQRTVLC